VWIGDALAVLTGVRASISQLDGVEVQPVVSGGVVDSDADIASPVDGVEPVVVVDKRLMFTVNARELPRHTGPT